MMQTYVPLNEFYMGFLPDNYWEDETILDSSGEVCYNCNVRATSYNPVVINLDTLDQKCLDCMEENDVV